MLTSEKAPSDATKHRVLIVDDHPIVRRGLSSLLTDEGGIVVCGEAEDVEDALEMVAATAPELVVVDNDSTLSYDAVFQEYRGRLPLRTCVELVPGIPAARNRGCRRNNWSSFVLPPRKWALRRNRGARFPRPFGLTARWKRAPRQTATSGVLRPARRFGPCPRR